MIKKKHVGVLIAVLCCLCSLQSFAQPGSGRSIIRLRGTSSVQANSRLPTVSIASIQIVAALPDSTTVGYLSQANDNVTIKLVPESNVSSWLQSYVNQQYGSTFNLTGKKLVWVIDQLSTSANASATQAFTRVKAGLYEATGTQLKRLSLADMLLPTTIIPGDSSTYSTAITVAMLALYNSSLAAISILPSITTGSSTLPTILDSIHNTRNLPILRDSLRKQGVYTSFSEFKANNPSIRNGVAVVDDNDSTKVKMVQRVDSVLQNIPNAWGFCVNGELYTLKAGKLIAIEVSNNSIVISRFQEPNIRKNQAIYWRRYLGERTGNINPFSREHSYPASTTVPLPLAASPEATGIDLETGALNF